MCFVHFLNVFFITDQYLCIICLFDYGYDNPGKFDGKVKVNVDLYSASS